MLCIGGYSALPSANLLVLGIMQACLPSALAELQLCLCSFNCGVLVVIVLLFFFNSLYGHCFRIMPLQDFHQLVKFQGYAL